MQKKRQCWEERDVVFLEAINDFKKCTNVITSFYANQSNLTNLNYANNNESNVNVNIIQDVINRELKTSQIMNGYEKELITTLRQVSSKNKRFVFSSVIKNVDKMISTLENNDHHIVQENDGNNA